MSEPFIGEIRIFPYSFAPRNWADCDGQTLPISQNPTLFAVIGCTYGGNCHSTFALPNLQGSVPLHPGKAPGLNNFYELGQKYGSDLVYLDESQLPAHTHKSKFYKKLAKTEDPTNNLIAIDANPTMAIWADDDKQSYVSMAPSALKQAGGGQSHENRQPYLVFRFCIAMDGIYPSRS